MGHRLRLLACFLTAIWEARRDVWVYAKLAVNTHYRKRRLDLFF